MDQGGLACLTGGRGDPPELMGHTWTSSRFIPSCRTDKEVGLASPMFYSREGAKKETGNRERADAGKKR